MRTRAAPATFISVVLISTAAAGQPSRMLMHTYQNEGILVSISFVDLPAGPVCHIDDGRISSASRKVRDFPISKQEFEHIWSSLRELTPYEQHPTKSSDTTDALNNYVFTIADMPDGQPKIFVVRIDRAPKPVAEFAREIRAYNRD
jgi:hypothetical protein